MNYNKSSNEIQVIDSDKDFLKIGSCEERSIIFFEWLTKDNEFYVKLSPLEAYRMGDLLVKKAKSLCPDLNEKDEETKENENQIEKIFKTKSFMIYNIGMEIDVKIFTFMKDYFYPCDIKNFIFCMEEFFKEMKEECLEYVNKELENEIKKNN